MRRCRNCENQRKRKDSNSKQHYKTVNQYGLPVIISPPRIVLYDNQYMLQVLLKTDKRTKRLDKSVNKLKKQLKSLRKSVNYVNNMKSQNLQRLSYTQNFNIGSDYEKCINDRKSSRLSSVNSSKNREIGRFTRVSQGEHSSMKDIAPDQDSIFSHYRNKNKQQTIQQSLVKGLDKSDTISFSKNLNSYPWKSWKQQKRNQAQIQVNNQQFTKNKYNSNSLNEKKTISNKFRMKNNEYFLSQNQSQNKKTQKKDRRQNNIQMYLPSYQGGQSSQGSYLISKQDSEQLQIKKSQIQRQFQQLVILQKKANDEQKKIIREEIRALSQMLGNMG